MRRAAEQPVHHGERLGASDAPLRAERPVRIPVDQAKRSGRVDPILRPGIRNVGEPVFAVRYGSLQKARHNGGKLRAGDLLPRAEASVRIAGQDPDSRERRNGDAVPCARLRIRKPVRLTPAKFARLIREQSEEDDGHLSAGDVRARPDRLVRIAEDVRKMFLRLQRRRGRVCRGVGREHPYDVRRSLLKVVAHRRIDRDRDSQLQRRFAWADRAEQYSGAFADLVCRGTARKRHSGRVGTGYRDGNVTQHIVIRQAAVRLGGGVAVDLCTQIDLRAGRVVRAGSLNADVLREPVAGHAALKRGEQVVIRAAPGVGKGKMRFRPVGIRDGGNPFLCG